MSDGLCPFAVHKLLPETDGDGRGDQPPIDPRVAILHSAAGKGPLYRYFLNNSSLESTFWIAFDGTIEQYGLTTLRADANRYANPFAVSIETESSVAATEPWTPAQVASILRLLDWLCTVHPKIKRQQCDAWNGSGIGWHTMWGSPSQWTPVAKSCPGPARIVQAREEIIPAIAAGKPTQPKDWSDMATEAQVKAATLAAAREQAGEIIGWQRALAEHPEWARDDPQSKRLADRAKHLNPYRKS